MLFCVLLLSLCSGGRITSMTIHTGYLLRKLFDLLILEYRRKRERSGEVVNIFINA
jgi:hypothetical protein